MYIWTAIDIDRQMHALREKATALSRLMELENPALTLPLHISLRISFFIDDTKVDGVKRRLTDLYRSVTPFSVTVEGLETNADTVWVKVAESPTLRTLHANIVSMLEAEFGVTPHPYDHAFLFHATLLQGGTQPARDRFYLAMKEAELPPVLEADTLIIGESASGEPGRYRVTDTLYLKN